MVAQMRRGARQIVSERLFRGGRDNATHKTLWKKKGNKSCDIRRTLLATEGFSSYDSRQIEVIPRWCDDRYRDGDA